MLVANGQAGGLIVILEAHHIDTTRIEDASLAMQFAGSGAGAPWAAKLEGAA